MFHYRIGQPFAGPQELYKLFSQYDTNHSGQLEVNEFLVLFKDRLQDLKKTLNYISMKPAKSKASAPSVIQVRPCTKLVCLCLAEQLTALCFVGKMLCTFSDIVVGCCCGMLL